MLFDREQQLTETDLVLLEHYDHWCKAHQQTDVPYSDHLTLVDILERQVLLTSNQQLCLWIAVIKPTHMLNCCKSLVAQINAGGCLSWFVYRYLL
ncbi:hypothetical protein [Paenibacillus taiwanensis]|uniref:hypothetical protein n=1 Tax=Paenibacillus taiwanensis TaxID=401638 RepID=UPI00048A5A12|nr:hypothetical protein [Paenibacillus taiwanensis]